jgi:hypothetical protein
MHHSTTAVVRSREILNTALGSRIQVVFETREGQQVRIHTPLEDEYMFQLQPQQSVRFHRDHYGCHHLVRENSRLEVFLQRLHRNPLHPSYPEGS